MPKEVFRGYDEEKAFRYASAAALAIDEDTLQLDAKDALEGMYQDTPYWRTKRVGHKFARDMGREDGLGDIEIHFMIGSVKKIVGNPEFVEHIREQHDQT